MNNKIPYNQGQIVGAATALLNVYALLTAVRNDHLKDALVRVMGTHKQELVRLIDNQMQIHNDWGDPVQLAGLIVFMAEGYRSSALDTD